MIRWLTAAGLLVLMVAFGVGVYFFWGTLRHGQKVFIQAGSGGVGTFAIQLAKHVGATVATTTSAANVELVEGLGADIVIDYKTQDFEAILDECVQFL